tara:strand:- start:270 stop:500 length:231 start_codon:yes stop_codon:yes gene_type:complete
MTNLKQVNAKIKKEVISLMGKGQLSYNKKVTRNDEFLIESTITLSYESTCQIGKIVDYVVYAVYHTDTKEISLRQK